MKSNSFQWEKLKSQGHLLQCEENKGKCLYAVQAEDKMEPAMEMTDRQEHRLSPLFFTHAHKHNWCFENQGNSNSIFMTV